MTTTSAAAPLPGVRDLLRKNPLLIGLAFAHLALVPLELAVLALDGRTLGGESVWLKPLRFDVSIAVYALTMTVVLDWASEALRERYSRRIAVAMIIETLCIGLQAARGVKSHFNIATPFDGLVFNAMGLAILYNSYLLVRILIIFARGREVGLTETMRAAVTLGLAATLIGSIVGGYMSARLSHFGPHGGDLRLGHFVGLHGLQFLLLAGALLSRSRVEERTRIHLLRAGFAVHLMATFFAVAGA